VLFLDLGFSIAHAPLEIFLSTPFAEFTTILRINFGTNGRLIRW